MPHLALIGSSVTVQGKVDSAISAVLVSEGNPRPERNLSPDYPIASVVFPPLVRKLNPTSMYCEEINQIITAFM